MLLRLNQSRCAAVAAAVASLAAPAAVSSCDYARKAPLLSLRAALPPEPPDFCPCWPPPTGKAWSSCCTSFASLLHPSVPAELHDMSSSFHFFYWYTVAVESAPTWALLASARHLDRSSFEETPVLCLSFLGQELHCLKEFCFNNVFIPHRTREEVTVTELGQRALSLQFGATSRPIESKQYLLQSEAVAAGRSVESRPPPKPSDDEQAVSTGKKIFGIWLRCGRLLDLLNSNFDL